MAERPSQAPDDDPHRYVGLPAEQAREQARAAGWTTVRVLPPGAVVTLEYLSTRLNMTADQGVVVRCWQG